MPTADPKQLTNEMEEVSDFDWTKAEEDVLNTTATWPTVWGTVLSAFYAVNVSTYSNGQTRPTKSTPMPCGA